MPANKKVLVIGGSGFIGKTLQPTLFSKGYDITVLNRGNKRQENNTQFIADRNSLGDMERVAALAGYFDAVIDTSAYTPIQAGIAWLCFSGKTNKWIHISSAAVYKDHQSEIPHKENDETGGAEVWGSYGRDKSAIDDCLASQMGSTRTVILRPPYIYGPNNDIDRETFIWSRAESGVPVILPPRENTWMQFLHVQDLAEGICQCIEHDFEENAVFNVASDEIITMRDWVTLLLEVCSRKTDAKVLKNTINEFRVRDYFPFREFPISLDTSRIKLQSNWKARYDLKRGFSETYSTYSAEDLKKYLLKISDAERELAAKLEFLN